MDIEQLTAEVRKLIDQIQASKNPDLNAPYSVLCCLMGSLLSGQVEDLADHILPFALDARENLLAARASQN